MADTGVLIIDDPRCMGSQERKELERQIMDHETPYRYCIADEKEKNTQQSVDKAIYQLEMLFTKCGLPVP